MTNTKDNTGWEHFEHRADVGVRGFGPDIAQAFEQGALAMIAVIAELSTIEAEQQVQITCDAPDDEILFIEWLSRLLYEMDTRKMLFSRFEVHIEDGHLTGAAWGEKTDVAKHRPAVEVKAATYSGLSVRRDEAGNWIAQCIVDV